VRERDLGHLGDPGVEGRIILRLPSGSGLCVYDWFELSQERKKWRALVHAVVNVRVP
jgi:hypothetical protein